MYRKMPVTNVVQAHETSAALLSALIGGHIVPHNWATISLIVIVPTTIFMLGQTKKWKCFAKNRKVASQTILFCLMVTLVLPFRLAYEVAWGALPIDMSVES